ncbi:helix-turn-helix domain-containing protein [Nocardia aurea]|uniref:helix-turn-helix domain-containing protein n=1 Tax=Nocardia aurea TaxID=2144174 RepID=UPI0013002F44|nr:helix-turn-helix domain-containing protein [Nocardia aurea]
MRPDITFSWKRSAMGGCDPSASLHELALEEVDSHGRLVTLAAPILDHLMEDLDGARLAVVLADRRACLTDVRCPHPGLLDRLEQAGALLGRQLTEETSGTNSVATVHELRRGVAVRGDEHYLESLRIFSCYGRPIRDPVTRRLQGSLSLVGFAEDDSIALAPLLGRVVMDLERELADAAGERERRMLAAFRAAARTGRPVLVLGEDVTLANAAAAELLEAADYAMLRGLPASRTVHLRYGKQVMAELTAIEQTSAVLCELREPPARTSAPGWTASRVLITGEPGTGRTTRLRELAGGDDLVVVEAIDAMSDVTTWLDRLRALAETHPGLLGVEDVQLLPPAVALRAARILDTAVGRVALTGTRVQEHAELLALCPYRLELSPLRERAHEIPGLVAAMTGGRNVRFTPAALSVMAAQDWPGNLRELAAVVELVLQRRGTGDITAADLPPGHRDCPRSRRLTALERAEYAAITQALRSAGGNKARAARLLGISRTTLYSRMKVFKI